ncbi:uncharacterized protein LOC132172335 [Corylus avellana]|uniref:uncharacterized protein LOC132172335 n=1 Tax=Corylus avellana TaxID=13451 RepID=UPI001E20A639|nr:uncharacterized protein LOC132172335 [Corylus avellana]
MEAMELTTATNKRKISHDIEDHHQEEEDDDEQKIDKFFALIKNLREARDRLMSGSSAFNGGDDQNRRLKRKVGEEKLAVVWKPSFQREDFMAPEEAAAAAVAVAAPFKNPPPVTALLVGSSSQRGGGNKENDTEGLDLRLSL